MICQSEHGANLHNGTIDFPNEHTYIHHQRQKRCINFFYQPRGGSLLLFPQKNQSVVIFFLEIDDKREKKAKNLFLVPSVSGHFHGLRTHPPGFGSKPVSHSEKIQSPIPLRGVGQRLNDCMIL